MNIRTFFLVLTLAFFFAGQANSSEDNSTTSSWEYYDGLCRKWAKEEEGMSQKSIASYIERCRNRLMGPDEREKSETSSSLSQPKDDVELLSAGEMKKQ
jgi:hypothetical protein